jgi:hypothetical protein
MRISTENGRQTLSAAGARVFAGGRASVSLVRQADLCSLNTVAGFGLSVAGGVPSRLDGSGILARSPSTGPGYHERFEEE